MVKDYERFLRNPDIIEAERVAGCDQVAAFPKASPDFNAIEGWWRRLKMHLEQQYSELLKAESKRAAGKISDKKENPAGGKPERDEK